jgi:hypothetical protein
VSFISVSGIFSLVQELNARTGRKVGSSNGQQKITSRLKEKENKSKLKAII